MSDFLLELLSEEIPARMQAKAETDIARLFSEQMAAAGLKAEAVETYSTPRRLALIARSLPTETEATTEETKGPRTSAPPQAFDGFLRKTGLTREQLVERDGTFFAVIEKPGRRTADVLADAIPAIVRAFPWPKSMRWGAASASTESIRWVRPLQGIVALLGEEIVPFEIAGVTSGAATVGHRFHHPGIITIGSANDYAEKLRACHVLIDPVERRLIIAEGARAAAAAAGLTLVEDEGLLAENAGLTEWPVPLLGSFHPAFLDVPPEVIQLTMRTNQKYFACTDASGALAPNFICTANIEAADGGIAIVAGNEKVLTARLSDAKFFWEQDLKVPLEEQAKKLDQILFHEKLGTVADKVERVAKLARWLVEKEIVGGENSARPERSRGAPAPDPEQLPSTSLGSNELADLAETAARLCKADLVTGMVGEFPELQGIIGGYLARAQGHPEAVADAIRDHYKPVGQGDEVPTAPVTVAVSLADKLDTILGFFLISQPPSGSKDPYALRRSAIGTAATVTSQSIRLPLLVTLANGYAGYVESAIAWSERSGGKSEPALQRSRAVSSLDGWTGQAAALEAAIEELKDVEADAVAAGELLRTLNFPSAESMVGKLREIVDFFADRLKVQQREAGVRHDLIDAVFALGGEDDLVRLLARVKALQSFVETPEGTDLLAGYKRASNILKKEGWRGAQKPLSYTPESEEAALIAALDAAEPRAAAAIEAEDFEAAMAALASLRAPVDAFFDKVTVNDPDPAKREFRLSLLVRMRDAIHRIADFSRIEG